MQNKKGTLKKQKKQVWEGENHFEKNSGDFLQVCYGRVKKFFSKQITHNII